MKQHKSTRPGLHARSSEQTGGALAPAWADAGRSNSDVLGSLDLESAERGEVSLLDVFADQEGRGPRMSDMGAKIAQGGTWKQVSLEPMGTRRSGVEAVGCVAEFSFFPSEDMVGAEQISLVQTQSVRVMGDAGVEAESLVGNADRIATDADEAGHRWRIDKPDQRERKTEGGDLEFVDVDVNPTYTSQEPLGEDATDLSENPMGIETSAHPGKSHDGETREASLWDRPTRRAGIKLRQSFEIAALVTQGELTGTYLGSCTWGRQSNGQDVEVFDMKVIDGPSDNFAKAVEKWNEATLIGPDGSEHATIDLPDPARTDGKPHKGKKRKRPGHKKAKKPRGRH